jgi:diaminopimelate epimerase
MDNKISFSKMVASGNDFVIIEPEARSRAPRRIGSAGVLPCYGKLGVLARKICDRKFGIGSDGLLVLGKSKVADVKMRIFNADGSEAEMCGNGARCVALWLTENRKPRTESLSIETKAGVIKAQVKSDTVKIKLTDPKNIKLDKPIKINNRTLKVNFINTGVPHTVIFASGLEKIDVFNLGRLIRYHKKFAPRGTNVNFLEILDKKSIAIRTYERGVEDETLACGTGSAASALIFALKARGGSKINVHTLSREVLTVYFNRLGKNFSNVWLGGKAKIVFKGEFAY